MDIAIDFDGTCVTHNFPEVGDEIGAVPVLRALIQSGHTLILTTLRCDTPQGDYLSDAIEWFSNRKIPIHINKNPCQVVFETSFKCQAEIYIDDKSLGIPLIIGMHKKPYVDWYGILQLLKERNIL